MAPADPPAPEPPPPHRPAWADLHLWQVQPVRDLLIGLVLLGLLVLGERLSLVTVPLLLAVFLAYLLEPLVLRLTRLSWLKRRTAVGALLVATVLFVVVPVLVGFSFGVLQGIEFAGGIARRTSAVIESVQKPDDEELRTAVGSGAWAGIRDFVVELKQDAATIRGAEEAPQGPTDLEDEGMEVLGVDRAALVRGFDLVARWIRDNAEQVGQTAITTGKGALTAAVSTVTTAGKLAFGAFLAAFFFFFLSTAWPEFVAFGQRCLPGENRERVVSILHQMDRAVHGFIRGRLTIAFFLGIFYTIGFWLMGVPAPLILGPAVSVVTLIPYAGLLAVPLVIVLLWLEGNTGFRGEIWWVLLAPFAWYQIGQALDDYVLTPVVQGKSTDLDTPSILFASIAGGLLLGFFGLLIAIPLAACAKILVKEVFWPRLQAWSEGREQDFLPLDRT